MAHFNRRRCHRRFGLVFIASVYMKSEKHFLPNLGICIAMDLIGMFTYVIPGIGEFADIAWAPISALVFYRMFGGKIGMIGGVLNFLEEIIPFTDVIPSFTIAWFIRKREIESASFKKIR